MWSTEIKSTYGYLGQHLWYSEERDEGPFCMAEQQLMESMYLIGTGEKSELTIAELWEKLLQMGYTVSGWKKTYNKQCKHEEYIPSKKLIR